MNAYKYGLKNYKYKYQPIPNVVVFNDKYVIEDDSDIDPRKQEILDNNFVNDLNYQIGEFLYIELEKVSGTNSKFRVIKSQKPLSPYVVENYLIPSGQMRYLVGFDYVIEQYNYSETQLLLLDNKYFLKAVSLDLLRFLYPHLVSSNGSFNSTNYAKAIKNYKRDFADVESKIRIKNEISHPQICGQLDYLLEDFYKNPNISVIFFVSSNGAKIDKSHIDINVNEIRDNEIIFFLEKDDHYNLFGSVCRVLSGKNIKNTSQFPSEGIAELASLFKVNTNKKEIETIAKEHIEKKSEDEEWGILYFLGQVVDAIVGVGTWLIKETFGDGLIAIGEGITSFKLGENRWKFYDDNGEKNKEFNPILPVKSLINSLMAKEQGSKKYENDDENNEDSTSGSSFEDKTSQIQKDFNDFIDYIPHRGIQDYLKDKLSFIPQIIEEISKLYNAFMNFIENEFVKTIIFINALFTGVLNSLIEAIGDIFSFIGMILSLPYYLHKLYKEKKQGSYVSLVFELLEDGIEGLAKLFSIENFIAVIDFIKESFNLVREVIVKREIIVSKLKQAHEFVRTSVDDVGYAMGYIIGFVLEETLTALASFGVKNAVNIFKASSNSLQRLLKTETKRPNFNISDSSTFIDAMIYLFDKIKRFDLKRALDTLIEWFRELISTMKELAEKAFKKLFPNNKDRNRMTDAGFEPTKVNAAGDIITFCPINRI